MKTLVAATLLWICATPAVSEERITLVLETPLGEVILAIETDSAPLAANYFLGYVDRGQYDGATLYRSASLDDGPTPQLVQGGLLRQALNSSEPIDPVNFGVASLLPKWETTAESGARHRRGSVSLARDLLSTGHVIPEIVFCLRDIPRMDAGGNWRPDERGFPVIGEVVAGLEVIEAISQRERAGATNIAFLQGQILSTPVSITRAYRQQPPAEQANQ